MDVNEVVKLPEQPPKPKLSPEELKRLTDFFSLLIDIDQRIKKESKNHATEYV